MLEKFTVNTFNEGDVFKLFYGDGQYVEITLVKSAISKYNNPISERDPFFLAFTSEKEIWIESGCYNMEQEKVGNFDLTITPTMPLKRDGQFNYYEAVFS